MNLYTPDEAAKILKCSVRTIRRAAHRINKRKGALRLVRFTESEILRMAGAK